ncbi:MAG TPA: metallopeptidase TldD-related protein [Kofleriaceae bacterium]|nr:metallopeptidase TldD-related protein [Kofleriaceae bacterium]
MRSALKRIACLLAFGLALSTTVSRAEEPKEKAPKKKDGAAGKAKAAEGDLSRAVTDQVLDAVATEMERSMATLRIESADSPYFIGYKITEVEVNDAAASLGDVISDKERHFVNLEAHVHVGDYKFDNSNFVASGREGLDGIAEQQLPLEPNPKIARRVAWLTTDVAYKEALEQLQAKREALKSGAAGGISSVPSYTKMKPAAMTEPVRVPKLEVLPELKKRAEKVSAVFRDQKHVRDSRVAFTSYLERRWLLNSEGNAVHDTRRASGVLIVASGQAQDGQELFSYYTRYGHTAADLPSDEELVKAARAMAKNIEDLQKAPLVENYTGPVLFEGEGAVGIVRASLAPNLSGTPLPVGVSQRDATRFGGALTDRIGARVVAPVLSVVDDPTTYEVDRTPLIGGYKIDDEGTPAERVSVIDGGTLRSLLMSRTPSKQIDRSNGHARLAMPGGLFRGSTTNLILSGKGGVDRKALVRKLLAEARTQGLKYAIVIRQLDDAAITANSELTRFERLQLLQGADDQAPPLALRAYRIYPNGKEELVRGVQLRPVQMRSWRDVVAVSKDRTVRNFLASIEDPALIQVNGAGPGFVPSAGVESSIATPDLLFRELDITPSTLGRRPEPAIPAP